MRSIVRRFLGVGIVAGLFAAGCEEGPDQIFKPLPDDYKPATVNGLDPANIKASGEQDFKFEQSGGKTKLTYVGDDYGVVKVGPHSTVFFLSNGESITFDENGDVIQFNGISHIYHPLNNPTPDYDEPVENASDASVSTPGRR